MKTLLAVIIGCALINSAYACCGDCQSGYESINKCQCSDPNYNSNPCLTVDQFCEAFGNISGLDAYP
jgi:hypothetical protein